jgi:hypothetical protein
MKKDLDETALVDIIDIIIIYYLFHFNSMLMMSMSYFYLF